MTENCPQGNFPDNVDCRGSIIYTIDPKKLLL